MAQKKNENSEYETLRQALNNSALGNLYIFHGEERYLLEHYLGEIRKQILCEGPEEFNFKRFEGRGLTIQLLADAIDALPVFSTRTLIEVYDFDIFKTSDETKAQFITLFSDIPDYVCLIFIYNTIEFNVDGRIKLNAALKKLFHIVEFQVQEKSELSNWISRRFKALGKRIDRQTAEYLAYISGGLMTSLIGEIEKVSAYIKGDIVTRESIDTVVTPVLDAVSWKLTEALARGNFETAVQLLDELIQIREPPHKILFSISLKMRQLLAAHICTKAGSGTGELMKICDIRYDFQARNLMECVRKTSPDWCKKAIVLCTVSANEMNSGGGDSVELLVDLLIQLAAAKKTALSTAQVE